MGFGVSMRYLHVGEGSFFLLYLLHKGINAVRPLIAKDASQRLKMPGKTPQSNRTVTGGNLQFSPLSSPAAGASVALGTRGQEGLARMEGLACPSLYLPLVPSTRLLCSDAAPCTESSSAAHSDLGLGGTSSAAATSQSSTGNVGNGAGYGAQLWGRTLSASGAMT